jgi:hypothetical protein
LSLKEPRPEACRVNFPPREPNSLTINKHLEGTCTFPSPGEWSGRGREWVGGDFTSTHLTAFSSVSLQGPTLSVS